LSVTRQKRHEKPMFVLDLATWPHEASNLTLQDPARAAVS